MESNNRNVLVDLNGKTITLGEYVGGINNWLREKEGRKVVIPSYQRNYKWESARAVKLVGDLIAVYKDNGNGNKKEKSIALFTLYLNDKHNRIDIVDGQQRFITLYLMFKALGKEGNFVSFEFERDCNKNDINNRKAFIECIDCIDKTTSNFSSDTRRFYYNYQKIREVIDDKENGLQSDEYTNFVEYINQNIFLLLHVVKEQPVEEFLNINCNKTQFSVCDIVRARVITGESRGGWETQDYEGILGNADYRYGVSALMEELSKLMYDKEIYDIVKSNYRINPDETNENRINLFYNKFLKENSNSFLSDQISQNINFDGKVEIIKLLQVLVFYKKILQEMEVAFGEKINDEDKDWAYRRILRELFMADSKLLFFDLLEQYFKNRIDENEDVIRKENMFAQILHEKFSIDKIVYHKISESSNEELYLVNRYFESIASNKKDNNSYSEIKNFKRNEEKSEFFRVDKSDFNDLLQGAGKYLLYRYVSEKQRANTLKLKAYHGKRPKETYEKNDDYSIENNMSVHKLFVESRFNIVIPDIQRDYCMGNHLERNEFMKFIKDAVDNDKNITISAITICNIKEGNRLYIYDGQQRCLTITIIMKWLGIENISGFKFEHRDYFTNIWKEFFESNEKNLRMPEHSYSMNSVNKLIEKLESYKLDVNDRNKWIRYFRSEKITFDIISLPESLSAVDQFFMDFNEGVQLVPYEIFKCRLVYQCEKVCDDSEVTDFKKKLDNEWLDFFYNCKEEKIEDESAIEELWEMRLLEFICRMIYWEKYVSESENKHPMDLTKFSDDGTEIGDMEILIDSLEEKDFNRIQEIMKSLKSYDLEFSQMRCVVEIDGIKGPQGDRIGFWHFNSSNYDKKYILVKFIQGITEGKIDENDLIAWSVLNGDNDDLVKFLMEEWNAQNILSDAFAVLVPYKAGIWKHICLEIPKYYIPDSNSDHEFQKQIEIVMRENMQKKLDIRAYYDSLIQKRMEKVKDKQPIICNLFDWSVVKGKYAEKISELSDSDNIKIFYYRRGKSEAILELYNLGKKSKFIPCAQKDYIFLVDAQQQQGMWIFEKVLTMASEGSTAFMKDLGEIVKIDNTKNEVSINRYIKNGQEYYTETRYYQS